MTSYHIEPERRTLHGMWSRDLDPVLTIASGDTVQFRTLDAAWGIAPPTKPGPPDVQFPGRDIAGTDVGHALCGPIAIRGAEPGMVLAVTIEELRPANWGWNGGGGGFLAEPDSPVGACERFLHQWTLDPDAGIGTNQDGYTVNLAPFMGVMGMPTDDTGWFSTGPPGVNGGNIDCKELVVGSTLYLPIAVSGGLFSTGDGHAAQGDGEVSGTAIECGMEGCVLRFDLCNDMSISTPWARTPNAWLTFGFDEDLDQASLIALNAMLDLMQQQLQLRRGEALTLASVAVDLRITQIVNGVKGVHAMLRDHSILK